jgi:hypothetical protein
MKIIKSNTGNFLAKVISKKNSKIYVLKQFRQNQDQQKLVQEFQILLNISNGSMKTEKFISSKNMWTMEV